MEAPGRRAARTGTAMHTDLVVRAQRGDEQAFTRLLVPIYDRLHQIAYRMLRDRPLAEEAVQQAALSMWIGLPKLRDPERFEAWSYRLVVNACYSEARRRKRRLSEIHGLATCEPVVRDEFGRIHDRDQLERGFARLSMDQRAVVVLHHYMDMAVDDVAGMLGIPPGTARSRLNRAISRMREALEAEQPGLVQQAQEASR
jgi:RNA polymerase sigma-70 factor (ECF subfamily)